MIKAHMNDFRNFIKERSEVWTWQLLIFQKKHNFVLNVIIIKNKIIYIKFTICFFVLAPLSRFWT
jgi:predicted Zn-dependent protease